MSKNVFDMVRLHALDTGRTLDEKAFSAYIQNDIEQHRNFRGTSNSIYVDPSRFRGEMEARSARFMTSAPTQKQEEYRPQFQQPRYSAPSAPSVATASSVNEVREKAKASKGFSSTLLVQGSGNGRSRVRSKEQEDKLLKSKQTGGVKKKTLLGSSS